MSATTPLVNEATRGGLALETTDTAMASFTDLDCGALELVPEVPLEDLEALTGLLSDVDEERFLAMVGTLGLLGGLAID